MSFDFAIYSHTDAVMQPCADITFPVMRAYGQKHGYLVETLSERLSDRRVVWDKIPLLELNIDRAEWSLYLDADILITNHKIVMESIVESSRPWRRLYPEADVLVATDENGFNFGAALFRNTPWVHSMLKMAWEYGYDPATTSEQHGLIMACQNLTGGRVVGLPQRVLNSYPWREYGIGDPENHMGNWEPGDFALHIPGATAEQRVEIFSRYKEKILW